jgi:hypothetical protein
VTLLTTLDQVQLSPVPIRLLARVWKTSSYLRNPAVPRGFADRSAAVDVGGQADEGRSPGAFINAIREVLHAGMMRVEVGGTQHPAVGEARMKSESDTNAADEDETKWSFLRRLIVAMAAQRLKKADEVVKPRPPARRDDSP